MILDKRITAALIELADTLIAGIGVIDTLHALTERGAELLEVDAAVVLLANRRECLQPVAASVEQGWLTTLLRLRNREGPWLDSYRAGRPAGSRNLATEIDRWPQLAMAATRCPPIAALATPLRLDDRTIGSLVLFRGEPGPWPAATVKAAHALSNLATLAVVHARAARLSRQGESNRPVLNARIAIEQAKGYVAEKLHIGVPEAFTLLLTYSRRHQHGLTRLARSIVAGEFPPANLLALNPPEDGEPPPP